MNRLIILLLAIPLALAAQAGPITYQGQLQDSSGPVDTQVHIVFELYEQDEDGSPIATESRDDVEVTDGLFQVELDFGGGAFDGSERWLQVIVDGHVLEPRQRITTVPVAIHALNVPADDLADEFWRRGGNAGTDPASDFLGTTDQVAFELRVGDRRAWRVEPMTDPDDGPNLIAGHPGNVVEPGTAGATIGGGGAAGAGHSAEANYVTIGGGTAHNATDTGATVGGGIANTASGQIAAVGGGWDNAATGNFATVAGGQENVAEGNRATVAGGSENTAQAASTTVGGGSSNIANQALSTVAGGSNNVAFGGFTAIAGGSDNEARLAWASVGGGNENTADGQKSTVGGGEGNLADGESSVVGGGEGNIVSGDHGVVSGGYGNSVLGLYGMVGGGGGNTAGRVIDEFWDWEYATVAGGQNNTAGGRYATVGGGENNEVSNNWATVGGGRHNLAARHDAVIGGGRNNEVDGRSSTIGGGDGNFIDGRESVISGGVDNEIQGFSTDAATIAGGEGNMVDDDYATVGGGRDNQATGLYATVVGGRENIASGRYSFAAGRNASATHTGSVVFGNGSFDDPISSEGSNEFRSQMPMYAPSFNTTSSRTVKHEVEPVDVGRVLERLLSLDIHTWEFLSEDDNGLHMGPMAEDFHRLFGLGEDERTIATVDAGGVAFAAIQGVHAELEAEQAKNAELRTRLAEHERRTEERLAALEEENAQLRQNADRNAELEDRLARLEALLLEDRQVAESQQ